MKKILQKIKKVLLIFVVFFFASTILTTIMYRYVPVPFTPLMIKRSIEQLADNNRKVRFKKEWVSIDDISPEMPIAVVAAEDQLFFEHYGFDIKAIQKAIKYNKKKKGKKIKGASTISQQTAKNVFLWDGRSWLRKGLEVYFTALIELFWTKERILEVYLNIIETGDGIYGAEAASQFYYNKSVTDINDIEAASIASILPSPLKWNPISPTPQVRKKQKWILRQMKNLKEGVNLQLYN